MKYANLFGRQFFPHFQHGWELAGHATQNFWQLDIMTTLLEAKQMNKVLLHSHAMANVGMTQSFPRFISLTVLGKCNLRCRMCYQNHKLPGEMPYKVIEKIEPILPYVESVNITGGEPLLYSRIDDFFEMCARNQCSPWIQTNGMLLDEERARHFLKKKIGVLKISCDGATEETYESIRHGGNFKKLINNIVTLQKLKQQSGQHEPRIEFNFVAMRSNIHELPALVKLASRIGVENVNVFLLRVAHKDLIPETLFFSQSAANEYYSQARQLGEKLGVRVILPALFNEAKDQSGVQKVRICAVPWENMTVNMNGTVAICCGGAGLAGDLSDQNFKDAWHHSDRISFRETVNTDNELPACSRCRMEKTTPDNIRTHIPDKEMAEQALEHFSHELDNPLP